MRPTRSLIEIKMELLVKNKVLLIIGLTFLGQTLFVNTTSAATITEGTQCTKLNKTLKSNKQTLICSNTALGKVWINLVSPPVKVAQMKAEGLDLINELSAIDSSSVTSFVGRLPSIQAELDAAQKKSGELNSLLATLIAGKSSAEEEIKSLPTRISLASTQVSQSQAALAAPQQNYTSLLSQLNSLSYEYSTATRAKSSYLTCTVLKDFGFLGGGCGSYNSYYDIVISRYNSMDSQVRSAKATYDGFKFAYDNAVKNYNDLVNSRTTLSTKVASILNDTKSTQEEILRNQSLLKKLTSEKSLVDHFVLNQIRYQEAPRKFVSQIETALKSKSATWATKLKPIFQQIQVFQFEMNLIPTQVIDSQIPQSTSSAL
jgi:hypothetical protein